MVAKLLGLGSNYFHQGPLAQLADAMVSPCWASPFWQSHGWPPRQKEPKGLAPASGSRCARLPSFHRCSEGRRARAIHGPSRLSRHPCRSPLYAAIPFGLLKGAIRWCLMGRAAKRLCEFRPIVGWVTRSLPTAFWRRSLIPSDVSIAVENASQFSTLRSPPKTEALCCCCHSRTSRRLGSESPSGGRA